MRPDPRRMRPGPAVGLALLLITLPGCQRVQPHLTLPEMRIGEPAFASTLVGYTGTPVVAGNRVDVLLNGEEIFPAKIELIRSARSTLNLAEYVFEEGEPASRVADAVAERCRAGVKVNVLLDAVGSLGMPTEYRQRMVDAGCRVESYRPLRPFTIDRVNYRNHRRILVADGRVAMVGGSGTSGKWAGNGKTNGHWRDTDVRVEGPVVEQLQGAFVENWLEATGVALGGEAYFPSAIPTRGPVSAQAVRSSPAGGSTSMYTMLLLAMSSARRSIYITNPYFLPEEKMTESLVRAARSGVRVVLLIPGVIDHALVRQASRGELGPLLQAGVEVYEYQSALLHAKTMVIDGHWSTVGSANLDPRSFGLSEELNMVMYDGAVARRLEQAFDEDLRHSKRMTYEAWRNRGFFSRMLEWMSVPIRSQM